QANPQAARAAIVLSDDERQTCEIWTRVMGYHRPVSSFNVGKQGEVHERKYFRERATDEAALRAAAGAQPAHAMNLALPRR
ncbi:anaerobic ribonucleoside-triphosphate reductase, partial [Burkholderia pseudomallei]